MKFYFTIGAVVAGGIISAIMLTGGLIESVMQFFYTPLLIFTLSIASSEYKREAEFATIVMLIVASFLGQFLVIGLLFIFTTPVFNSNELALPFNVSVFGYIMFLFIRKAFQIDRHNMQDIIFWVSIIPLSLLLLTPSAPLFFFASSLVIGIIFDHSVSIENSNFNKLKPEKMETGNSFSETLTNWFKTSITFKMIVVGFLMIVLIVPMFFVSNLIMERETLQQEAILDISSKWGGSQFLVGPVLVIPYKHKILINGKESFEEHNAYFMPEELNISGGVNPETLNRGIYDVTVYNTDLNFKGKFNPPDVEALRLEKDAMMWKDAYLCLGVSDMKGIKENIKLTLDGREFNFSPGVDSPVLNMSGLSAQIGDTDSTILSDGAEFSFRVDLNGSQALNFAPLGKETQVNLNSSWINPGFDGSFLPDKREISESGFTAEWKVLNLNRSYPQEWTGEKYKVTDTFFGVNLLQPIEQYQKIDRSAKYAFLFIFLTFVIFFFVEVINKTRIHPIRYLLVGLALIIFYTLLLSISEIIGFENAYITASAAVVILISVYSKNFLKTWLLTGFMFLILSALYGFLFFTIQLQDYSLLAGSIGLFVILAILMYFSRKINYEKEDIKQVPEPVINN